MNIHERILRVQALLGRSLRSTQSFEEKDLLEVATAALMFISETGAVHSFEDYLQFRREDPPRAVAIFKSRDEADAWLRQHRDPPHGAFVVIADEYHIVMYVREMNHRQLHPHPILEGYLEQIQPEDVTALPSFDTRADADAWLKERASPSPRTFMRIAGQRYVALHHRYLDLYSIHLLPDPEPQHTD